MKPRFSIKNILITVILLLLGSITVVISISLIQSKQVNANARIITNTQEALISSERLFSLTETNATSFRGYLVSGEKNYLDLFGKSQTDISGELSKLKTLTRDNATQQKRIDTLSFFINKRTDLYNKLLKEREKKGSSEFMSIADTRESELLMGKILHYINIMKSTEFVLLDQRRGEDQERIIALYRILEIAIVILLVLLGFFISKLRSDFLEKRKAAMLLEKINEDLEKNVLDRTIELSETKNDLIETFNRITDAFIAIDANWCYTYANKRTGELIQRDPESLIGKNVWEEFPEAVGSDTYKVFHKVMKEQKYICNTDYFAPLDLWQENHVYPSPNGIFVYIRDITKKKKTEIELNKIIKSLEDYRFALDQSSIISITDRQGYITHINDNFCKISKYSREELIGKTNNVINSGFHQSDFFNEMWNTISSGKVWRGQIRNTAKTGEYYWVDTTIVPFLDKNNKPLQYLSIHFDITEKKIAEEHVLNTLRENNIILESIDDAFFAVDRNWIVTYWNSLSEKVLGRPKIDIIGKNLWEAFPDSVNSQFYLYYHKAMRENIAQNFEEHSERLNLWYEVSVYPSERGLSVYFKDVTDRKLSELQLKELNEHLQSQAHELVVSNRYLEQFAYVASHDLQEPLRMVTSFLTILEKKYASVIDEKGKQYIYYAVDGAKRMRQIILDLLEFSRVGTKEDKMEDFNLNDLVNEIQILFRNKIEEKNATIHVGVLPTIKSYKVPLRQVFQNLISNSLKYARVGIPCEISIKATELKNHWQFEITDNGIGIDEEYFEKIFVIFQRLHSKEEYSGTGIGLAIAKKIIENVGGKIWVASEEGKGASFYFTILKALK